MNDEVVLVVKDLEVKAILKKYMIKGSGMVTGLAANELINLCYRTEEFSPRSKCETDTSLRQVIPYITIRHDDRILVSRRTVKQGEQRLHGKYHLGFGGHVNVDMDDDLYYGAARELREELGIDYTGDEVKRYGNIVGVIASDINEVSKVHIAIVSSLVVDFIEIKTSEEGHHAFEWMPIQKVLTDKVLYHEMEAWSQLIIDSEN